MSTVGKSRATESSGRLGLEGNGGRGAGGKWKVTAGGYKVSSFSFFFFFGGDGKYSKLMVMDAHL